MSDHPLGERVVTQVGIMVKDIERSVEAYSRIFGVEKPPIIVTDGYEKSNANYKGHPTHARAKLAFFKMGQVSIELIEPIGEPSTWKEHLDKSGESVHHIAFVVPDTNKAVEFLREHGMGIDQQGDYTGGMYTYIDSTPQLGVAIELLQNFGDRA
jgi:catechol 2,3-dioxygenase-like lactoylglutathione lyase family enzyme